MTWLALDLNRPVMRDLWVSSGQDGQLLKIDQNGNVLGAVGNGSGFEKGQFIESNYMTWDKQGNL